MIDLKDLRQRPELYQKACNDKRITFDVSQFLELDSEHKKLQQVAEQLRAEQNELGAQVPKLQGEAQAEVRSRLKGLSAQVKDASAKLVEIEKDWLHQQLLIPSIPLDSVPIGKDDTENTEMRIWGEIPKWDFTPRDHIEIGEGLGLFDVARGVKIAGARNYFLCGAGARLHHAVLQLALDFIDRKGYKLMEPPHIVNYDAMAGTGYFPGGEEMAYHLDERDGESYLIGTSEVALVSFNAKETFNSEELPKRYAGYSPCYRREAGSYGKDTKGLYRVHQFYKVEQVVICEPDIAVSAQLHQELLSNAEELMQMLELPYRVVEVCTGDLGQGQVYKNDIEAWMPSRESYSETHSCSTLYDFQARRSEIRFKGDSTKGKYCHTLNNTLVASPRILIPLIEMHQQADGSLRVPKALQSYMGGIEVISNE